MTAAGNQDGDPRGVARAPPPSAPRSAAGAGRHGGLAARRRSGPRRRAGRARAAHAGRGPDRHRRPPAGARLLLTQRTDHLRDHAGQISFPGGRIEPGDESTAAAALREAEEEIGLDPGRVEILGELAPYDTVTGFRIIRWSAGSSRRSIAARPLRGRRRLRGPAPLRGRSAQPPPPQPAPWRAHPGLLRIALSGTLHLGSDGEMLVNFASLFKA